MDDPTWTAVDHYFEESLLGADETLAQTLRVSAEAGLPPISVSATQGRFLGLLARATNASRILEVGTLGGYSSICMARSLPPGGTLVTLEIDAHHAEVARANILRAGLSGQVEVRVGPAVDSLEALAAEGGRPWDLVFIDADKASNALYFAWAMRLTSPGSLIVVDNVVRHGAVVDPGSSDINVLGVRRLIAAIEAESRFEATAVQTVGTKGYDGFVVGLVVDPSPSP